MSDLAPALASGHGTPRPTRSPDKRNLFRVLGVVLMGTALVLSDARFCDGCGTSMGA